ncbi:MAG TPA: tetratricopeptide repeat protein, partial [Anaerolineae bacterium]|nr:tetratricopeptide repeat protein [Anaerolineae bacterium]
MSQDPSASATSLLNEKLRQGEDFLSRGELGAALAEFQAAIDVSPNNARAHSNMGSLYWRSGDKNRAIQHWIRAFRVNSQDSTVVKNLGAALEMVGDHAAARHVFSTFLKANPNNAEITRLLRMNQELTSSSAAAPGAISMRSDVRLLDTLKPENIMDYTYSKNRHFASLEVPYFHKDKQKDNCDLKVYQDMVIFNFLLSSLPRGARILEVGGGHSRIIRALHNYFECWNLDKFEGIGNGPTAVQAFPGIHVVQDYIGGFSKELPDNYFDCVYSISTLEHVPEEQEIFKDIAADIKRILRPGGYSVHCFDILITMDGVWTNELLNYFFNNENIINRRIRFEDILADPDIYVMSEKFYNASWIQHTGESYKDFGKPL